MPAERDQTQNHASDDVQSAAPEYDVHQEESIEDTTHGDDNRDNELEALRQQLEEANESLLRLRADFANYRKRMQAEQARWEERAVADFVRSILPVLDNLERAISVADDNASPESPAWLEGVNLVVRQFRDILAGHGVEPIDATGKPFDPHYHEALAQVETDQVPENHIVEEFQRGYRFKDQVLRPSLVSVAKSPGDPGAGNDKEESARG